MRVACHVPAPACSEAELISTPFKQARRLPLAAGGPASERRRLRPPCRALRAPRHLRRGDPCPQGHVRPRGLQQRFKSPALSL